jgi:hypothetical protein
LFFRGTYEQLSIYCPLGFWSFDSVIISHYYFGWLTRGLFPGYRLIAFSAQVDDLFLDTTTDATKPPFRLNEKDMAAAYSWQQSVSSRMNPGSSFILEFVFNANGVFNTVSKYVNTISPILLNDAGLFFSSQHKPSNNFKFQ